MATTLRCALAAITCLSTAVTAQTTWIVDVANGPGTNFVDVQSAVAAASAGDTILVRSGTYTAACLDIDKPLSILGLADDVTLLCSSSSFSMPGILVHDIPAGQAFALRRVRVGGSVYRPDVEVVDCAGAVLLDTVRDLQTPPGSGESTTMSFTNCAQVHVHAASITGPGHLGFTNTRGVITNTTITGAVFVGIAALDSVLTIDSCSIDQLSFPIMLGVPVSIDGGEVKITRTNVTAGMSAAIAASNLPTLLVDLTTTLLPGPGQPAIAGAATVANGEFVATSPGGTDTAPTLELLGRAGAVHASFVSFPGPVTPSPFGDLWINPLPNAQLLLELGVFQTREHTLQLPSVPLPTGVLFSLQSLTLDSALTFGNGVHYVVP